MPSYTLSDGRVPCSQKQEVSVTQVGSALAGMYAGISILVGTLVFVGSWIYYIASFGFVFGFGLGWLPAALIAILAAIFWPIGVLACFGLSLFVYFHG